MDKAIATGPFDYESLDEQAREVVLQKTAETHGLLKRTAESIIAIGNNLLEVQKVLPEMKFSAWLRAEFDLSRRSAYNFIRVATRFGGSCATVAQLPARVLYALVSASDVVVEQVETGQIAPTQDAIKKAKEAERQAREAEQLARADLQTYQAKVEQLTRDLEAMSQELAERKQQAIQIKEVEKQVVPPEVTEQLAALQHKVKEMKQQKDSLIQRITSLQEEIRLTDAEQAEGEHDRQVRRNWYKITSEFQKSLRSLLVQWPEPLDVLAFEADDWTRLSHVKELARRFLAECTRLTDELEARIIEGSTTEANNRQEAP